MPGLIATACYVLVLLLLLYSHRVSPSYPPYYHITSSYKNILGYYSKTEESNTVGRLKIPIYKKSSPLRYLLSEPATGNWIIAKDKDGKMWGLRQIQPSWPLYPDTDQIYTVWINRDGHNVYDLKVTASEECYASSCEAKEDTNNDFQSETQNVTTYLPKDGIGNVGRETDKDNPKEDTNIVFQSEIPNVTTLLPNNGRDNGGIETGQDNYMFIYVGCGVGAGVILLMVFLTLIFCLRNKRHLRRRETIDENPDYGDAYYGGRSQVMDLNDYYSIEG